MAEQTSPAEAAAAAEAEAEVVVATAALAAMALAAGVATQAEQAVEASPVDKAETVLPIGRSSAEAPVVAVVGREIPILLVRERGVPAVYTEAVAAGVSQAAPEPKASSSLSILLREAGPLHLPSPPTLRKVLRQHRQRSSDQ